MFYDERVDTLSRRTFGIMVAAHNAADTIERTINSIASQTYSNWRCVIVDDGSTDKTAHVVISAIGDDERFVFTHQNNGGTGAARNKAAARLEDPYLFYVDADDTIEPTFIETVDTYIAAHPDFDAYSPNARFDGEQPPRTYYPTDTAPIVDFDKMARACCIIGGGTVVTRAIFSELDGFNPDRYAEDYDFWLRFIAAGHRIHIATRVLYHYHGNDDRNRKSDDLLASLESARASLQEIADDPTIDGNHRLTAGAEAIRREELIEQIRENEEKRAQKDETVSRFSKLFGRKHAEKIVEELGVFARPLGPRPTRRNDDEA